MDDAMMIEKVLISGGREVGGLASFASNLLAGFQQIGIPGNVEAPRTLLTRWDDLRDPSVLKILSTGAVFLAPLCRNAICVAHGFPRTDAQGYLKAFGILVSFALASKFSRLVCVSHYVKTHLKAVFNIPSACVIHNPLSHAYLQSHASNYPRRYITYVGRLNGVKNIDRLIDPIRAVLDRYPHLTCLIIGDGELRGRIKGKIGEDPRFVMLGELPPEEVKAYLAKTVLFFSGCETEALGIAYLEALSQGCKVIMPASGGGLEISLPDLGKSVFLLPLDFDEPLCVEMIRKALETERTCVADMSNYSPSSIARRYLEVALRP
jgi:glycosyltransferase involved in cell wall biosynthesis